MLQSFLSCQEHSEYVRIKHPVELLLGDFFEWDELVNASVVDQDVDLPECLLCFSEEFLDVCLFCDIALDSESSPTGFAYFVHHAIRVLLCGCVVYHYRRSFVREV